MSLQYETPVMISDVMLEPADIELDGIEHMLERPPDTTVECAMLGELFGSDERVAAMIASVGMGTPGSAATAAPVSDNLITDDVEGLRVDDIERMFEPPVDRSALVLEGLEEFFSAGQAEPVDYATRFDSVIAGRATGPSEPPLPSIASAAGDFQ